jgi:phenylpyruvate tautomerase
MPLLKLQVSVAVPPERRTALLAALSKEVAAEIGKPERYVMVALEEATLLMSGQEGPAAFIEVRSIGGLGGSVNNAISQKLCTRLESELDIPSDRIYINFTDVPASDWGWDGQTFG